jgi:hypothetical protein
MPTRREKIEALLNEHLPPAPVRHIERPPTQFEVQFYQDLVAYKVPMEPMMRDRGYVVGRIYMMYGGTDFNNPYSNACIELGQMLNRVGLKLNNDDNNLTICKKPAPGVTEKPEA